MTECVVLRASVDLRPMWLARVVQCIIHWVGERWRLYPIRGGRAIIYTVESSPGETAIAPAAITVEARNKNKSNNKVESQLRNKK
jgi:hypothetical protein